ncbi:lipid-A-disaccharide synthase [Ahrensia sp. 13_GOM-1096m]|uniref:lipid-A-disaccharide synthase n=1 Tax=Ahrensia sp. 13_GOM-1096m TaxID=1380380 RepID=UPI0004798E0A|nr:lipid-A-disaccharide synthase [Ahrensia sp. 13_GOM-1096m]
MTEGQPYKIGIVAGEESGQLLASELIDALNGIVDQPVKLIGVGGERLESMGLKSIFDPAEIAITGVSAVIKTLPKLIARIKQTADAIIKEKPDCLLLIDSPDFSLRVAKKVKATLPDLPIVKYVAPTVWAWRPERAAKMASYINEILAILPFEPEVMQKLGGPKTHYVGHRLISDVALKNVWEHNYNKVMPESDTINLLVLPGSRSGEINALMDEFGKTVHLLHERGNKLNICLPTLPRLETRIRQYTASWPVSPTITTDRASQIDAYRRSDVALAASGTVTLELALAGIPAISCYRVDPIMRLAKSLITTWSAALPNIIVDRPIIKEFYEEFVRAGVLARSIEELVNPKLFARQYVLEGYSEVRKKMAIEKGASQHSAEIIAKLLSKKN